MNQKGFTLPELLVTSLLIGLMLLAAVSLARPENFDSRQLAAERLTGVAQQMQDLSAYAIREGSLPEGLSEEALPIGSEEGMLNLCPFLVPEYADNVVYDPELGLDLTLTDAGCREDDAFYVTGLEISKNSKGEVIIAAGLDDQKVSITKRF
jgi:prepilin-type N-terminal cleavage/methylation domain-containing protein